MDIDILASSSDGNCTVIGDGQSRILIDCGVPWRKIQQHMQFRTSELEGVLISHSHADHSKAVKDAMKAGIDCYMSASTASELGVSGHRVKLFEGKKQFRLGSWIVLPFPLVHDVENYGFLMANSQGDKHVHITDTAYCPFRFSGLTSIAVEANYSLDILRQRVDSGEVPVELKNRLMRTHMSLQTAKEFLLANDLSRVEAIYLIHLSNGNSNAASFKREVMAATGKPVYIAEG